MNYVVFETNYVCSYKACKRSYFYFVSPDNMHDERSRREVLVRALLATSTGAYCPYEEAILGEYIAGTFSLEEAKSILATYNELAVVHSFLPVSRLFHGRN